MESRKNKLISVIVPVFNKEKYMRDCIDSILGQSYEKLQIILVDDGSTDKSGEICDWYAKYDSRVAVLHKENGGVSTARNAGITIAKGEYIIFVDSDDFLEKDYCTKMITAQEKKPAAFVVSSYQSVCRNEIRKLTWKNKEYSGHYTKTDFAELLEMGEFSSIFNKIYRREVIVKNNISFIPGIHYGEDGLFCLSYLEKLEFDEIILLNQAGYVYITDATDSLSKGFHQGVYQTIVRMNHLIFDLSEKWKIEKKENIYKYAAKGIETALLDYMKKENPKPFLIKYHCCNKVLRTKKYNDYLVKAGVSFSLPRRIINKAHNILVLMLYLKFCSLKQKANR